VSIRSINLTSKSCAYILGLVVTTLLTACNDGTAPSGTAGSASVAVAAQGSGTLSIEAYSKRARRTTTTTTTTVTPVTISGTPATTDVVGTPYSFAPVTANTNGATPTFSVSNLPAWATFNAATGQLSGTPTAAGSYAGITISVSNGQTSASLAPFTVLVTAPTSTASVTLSWLAPTQNTDGSTITNLSGYRIYYGTDPNALAQTITLNSPSLLTYVVGNLAGGTWYFAIKAVNSNGVESNLSAVASTVIS